MKDELEALQETIRDGSKEGLTNDDEDSDFQRVLLHSSLDDVRQLRRERDLLLDRVAEMEAEVIAGRVHTSRLQEDLEHLLCAKQDLEDQLRAVMTQSGEVNTRIHDLHLQFVTKSGCGDNKVADSTGSTKLNSSQLRTRGKREGTRSALGTVFGDRLPKVKSPDSRKITAILRERDPLTLQRHLLTSTVHNQVSYK